MAKVCGGPLKFQGACFSFIVHGTDNPFLLMRSMAWEKSFESNQWHQKTGHVEKYPMDETSEQRVSWCFLKESLSQSIHRLMVLRAIGKV